MNTGCREFRHTLESVLQGGDGSLSALDWHEHVLWCEACRTLLEQEEALEGLLATLPEPQLPTDLAQRVLARLSELRSAGLDDLLALDGLPDVPDGLATRIASGLEAARSERRLDGLLDLDQVDVPAGLAADVLADARLERLLDRDAVTLPVGLAGRVLAALRHERVGSLQRAAVPLTTIRRSTLLRAAALVLATAGLWWSSRPGGSSGDATLPSAGEPAPELLAALDMLEQWEELETGSDLTLDAFSGFDAGDEALLEFLSVLEDGETPESDGENG